MLVPVGMTLALNGPLWVYPLFVACWISGRLFTIITGRNRMMSDPYSPEQKQASGDRARGDSARR